MHLNLNHASFAFSEQGNGRVALVLLHYFGGGRRSWQPLITRLAGDARCIALDLRGCGESDVTLGGYHVDQQADDIAALIAALHIERYVLVGHSMGGKIAMALAARRPAGLAGLMLLAPSPPTPEPIPDDKRAEMLHSHGDLAALRTIISTITAQPLPAALFAQELDNHLHVSLQAWRAWLEHGSREDISATTPQINVPTLVLSGGADETMPIDLIQREVVTRIAGAQLVTLPNIGHLSPLEAPDVVAAQIRALLERLDGQGGLGSEPDPKAFDAGGRIQPAQAGFVDQAEGFSPTAERSGIEPASKNSYPPGSVRALLTTDLVTPATRAALQQRLAADANILALAFFTEHERATLAAIYARWFPVLPAPPRDAIPAAVDARLAAGKSDGWRYDALPSDQQAYRGAIQGIDESAVALFGVLFTELAGEQQDAVLQAVQAGRAPGATWRALDSQRCFEDLLAEATELYYSHPLAQERIGYAGMADARGWQRIGLNQREAWEPEPQGSEVRGQGSGGQKAQNQASSIKQPFDFTLAALHPFTPSSDEVDAIVIGTGAGGGPLLARLAAAGLRVVALEAGQHWQPARDFATDERAQDALFWNDERLSAGDNPVAFGRNNSGIGVGGTTLHYTAYVPRAQPDDLRLHSEFGVGVDWPLSYADLAPYYDEVERVLGVSGPSPYPWGPPRAPYPLAPLPLNGAAQLMQRGCAELGIRTAPAANAALSARYYQPGIGWRPACTNRGFCQAGCSTGAKSSVDVTFIPLALAAGAEIRTGCFVTAFETAPDGRISAVIYIRDGKQERLRCRHLFVCAGAIETPRLLLLNSIANSSGQVGRNFMAHTGVQVWGQFEDDVRPYKGIPGALISEDMHRPAGADFAGGYLLQSIGVMPVTYASQVARGRGLWGAALDQHLRGYNHTAGIDILGECLPSASNYLELSDERDVRGLPKPRIHFSNGENERKLSAHGEAIMRQIWTAAGARDIWAFPRNAHTIGTCRMGHTAADAVVNADGRSFDVPNLYIADNSLFPSALSVNPALTIMALSLRIADRFLAHNRTE